MGHEMFCPFPGCCKVHMARVDIESTLLNEKLRRQLQIYSLEDGIVHWTRAVFMSIDFFETKKKFMALRMKETLWMCRKSKSSDKDRLFGVDALATFFPSNFSTLNTGLADPRLFSGLEMFPYMASSSCARAKFLLVLGLNILSTISPLFSLRLSFGLEWLQQFWLFIRFGLASAFPRLEYVVKKF